MAEECNLTVQLSRRARKQSAESYFAVQPVWRCAIRRPPFDLLFALRALYRVFCELAIDASHFEMEKRGDNQSNLKYKKVANVKKKYREKGIRSLNKNNLKDDFAVKSHKSQKIGLNLGSSTRGDYL